MQAKAIPVRRWLAATIVLCVLAVGSASVVDASTVRIVHGDAPEPAAAATITFEEGIPQPDAVLN